MLLHSLDRRAAGHSPLVVLSDPLDAAQHAACCELLTDPGAAAALVFAYHRRPRVLADRFDEQENCDLDSLTVLDLGERVRGDAPPDLGPAVTVTRCQSIDATRIGVAVSDVVDRHDDGLGACLGSVTTLLQYVDHDTAVQFLDVTLDRLATTDGPVHAHLDPDALDEETTETVCSLFDARLARTDDGWRVDGAPDTRTE